MMFIITIFTLFLVSHQIYPVTDSPLEYGFPLQRGTIHTRDIMKRCIIFSILRPPFAFFRCTHYCFTVMMKLLKLAGLLSLALLANAGTSDTLGMPSQLISCTPLIRAF